MMHGIVERVDLPGPGLATTIVLELSWLFENAASLAERYRLSRRCICSLLLLPWVRMFSQAIVSSIHLASINDTTIKRCFPKAHHVTSVLVFPRVFDLT
mmetsp:Transcript_71386/g.231983  ORF Transcript_71386/g.231983 Transcript_71386/m.231983 type:complete len:99 (+) Transcript_71386:1412-1708(+)